MATTLRKENEHEKIVPYRSRGMFDEMERMFENLIPRNWMRPMLWQQSLFSEGQPHMDVIERDDTILVKVAIPGIKKEDLEVSTTDHSVTVRGSTRKETEEEEGEYYHHEIVSGNFLRTVTLPASVDESKAKAVFKDGILELTLPKLESAKRHTVKVEEE